MNRTKKAWSKIKIPLYILLTIIVCIFFLVNGMFFVVMTPISLLFGWIYFIARTIPKIEFNLLNLAFGTILICILLASSHLFFRWLFSKKGWNFNSTLKVNALILVFFILGISSIGISHQAFWIATHKERFTIFKSHIYTKVKTSLAELYTEQINFKTKHGFYTNNLIDLNFKLDFKRYFAIGFPTACRDTSRSLKTSEEIPNPFILYPKNIPTDWFQSEEDMRAQIDEKFEKYNYLCKDPKHGFVILAVGKTKKENKLDVWIINENKDLEWVEKYYQ